AQEGHVPHRVRLSLSPERSGRFVGPATQRAAPGSPHDRQRGCWRRHAFQVTRDLVSFVRSRSHIMTRRASLVLLFTFGLLFAGCSDDESGDDNDTIDMSGDASDMGDDADATQTCNSNAECTMADQICDTATSTCVDSCLIAACDTGLVCDQ